jgi:hypothetical protein
MLADALQRLTSDHERYFPGQGVSPRILSVRPQVRRLSEVARVELGFPASTVDVYVKVHRHPNAPADRVHRKAQLEYDTLSYLYERLQGVPGCSVVRPIAFFPEHPTVVTEAVQGRNLHGLVKRDGVVWRPGAGLVRLERHCRDAGTWLRHFQGLTDQGRTERMPVEALLRRMREDLEFCVAHGLRANRAADLAAFAEARGARIGDRSFPVVGQHPDFQPDNVLVCADGVTVLDFTSFRYGAPLSDVARFVAHVEVLRKNPLYTRSRTDRLSRAFLDGYGWGRGDSADGFLVYLAFFVVRAVRTAVTWRWHPLVQALARRRAIRFLDAWCGGGGERAESALLGALRTGPR